MILKAVIPAAGLGTRLLPATKSQPKEMLPIVDRPAIHYVVEEASKSGIESILIVTGRGKEAIENYFDHSFELESILEKKKDRGLLEEIENISSMAKIFYVRQKNPLGLGHAIYQAKGFIKDEPFGVLLADDIFIYETPPLRKLIDVYEKFKGIVIGVKRVPRENVSMYGIVKVEKISEGVYEVIDLIEKPDPSLAPSNIAIIGRYILVPSIFNSIEETKPGKNNEIQLTDAIKNLIGKERIFAVEIEEERFDVGDKVGFLIANVVLGLRNKAFGENLKEKIIKLIK